MGHEIINQVIKPLESKVEAIQKLKTPENKRDVMRFVGTLNFYSKYIENLHTIFQPLYTLLHDDVPFKMTPELYKLFNEIKNSLTKNTELAIPNTDFPFYILVDASLIGLGAVLFQPNKENKMQVLSITPEY